MTRRTRSSSAQDPTLPIATKLAVALNAVIAAIDDERPKVLCVKNAEGNFALPYGPFDPERHRTFEIGIREWVSRQTSVSIGYIEQLYTFGDEGREAPAAALADASEGERVISVGYLALAPELSEVLADEAVWREWYGFFPWEDWRRGEPIILREMIIPELKAWIKCGNDKAVRERRQIRMNAAFGLGDQNWEEERALDRYELLYEAGLVLEAWRDRNTASLSPPRTSEQISTKTGQAMISDHRRILATAIARLRGKLKYRPIIFEMTTPEFTLLQLQKTVEAIAGFEFHKQNFRRSIENSGFVERTGKFTQQSGGRPAALFRIDREGVRSHRANGLAIPRLRQR